MKVVSSLFVRNVFLSSLTVLFSTHSFAEATLSRVKGSRDDFFISDSSCELVKKHVSILASWTKKINAKSTCDQTKIKIVKKDGSCEAKVSDCLPPHVLQYQGVNPATSGPNCWNLSLVMKNILPGLRYSSPNEMAYYMRPPLCRALKNGEKKEVGDVGAIRGVYEGMKEESHGFIYLSEDLSYSKNGFSKTSPYEVQSTEKVLSIYGVPTDLKCRANELDTRSDCGSAVSYFRCQSFEDFLKKSPNLKAPVLSSLRHVMHFEQCLERSTIDGIALRSDAVSTLETSIQALVKYLNDKKAKIGNGKTDEEESFLLGSLYFRLSAIGEQVEIAGHSFSDDSLASMMGPGDNAKKAFELAEMIEASHGELDKILEGINQ